MEIKSFTFSAFNDYAPSGIAEALKQCSKNKRIKKTGAPVIVCIGSDLVLGDSLGPLIGTFLEKEKYSSYVYGTLCAPITAKEVLYTKELLKTVHANNLVISIDAAVGDDEDVGLIRVANCGLKPGLGVAKSLGVIGDISIMGIVAGRSNKNYNLFNLTRLGFVYKMAQVITGGLKEFLSTSPYHNTLEPTPATSNLKQIFAPDEEDFCPQKFPQKENNVDNDNTFLFGS
ncbi:MAG: spore protease YyaC [Clostridia bacterium]|nr:spore protease YyaC [Clostridia bacterium]